MDTHSKDIDGWSVSWESLNDHRLWCHQEHSSNSCISVVEMLNPGHVTDRGDKNIRSGAVGHV